MFRSAALPLALLILLAAPESARAQKATAVAMTRADLNADAKPDEIRLDEMGIITVHIAGSSEAGAWTSLQSDGKVLDGSVEVLPDPDAAGRRIIVIKSVLRSPRARRRDEGVVLAYAPGKLESVWRGRLGLAGGDGGTTLSLELSKYGLIKYYNRHGVVRCDGETAHLEAERFDPKSSSFRPVRQSVRVAADAPRLVASESVPEGLPADAIGFLFRPQGASSSTRASSAAELVAPLALSDGNPKTAWVENKGGFGRGEFVTLKASIGEVSVKALRLQLGHGDAFNEHDRPKRLALLLGKDKRYWIDVPKDPKLEQWVVLPEAVRSNCVSLVIDEVYSARRSKGRTAISEVSVLTAEELSPEGSARLLADRIASGRASGDIQRLMTRLGAKAAPALKSAIGASKDPRATLRLRLALAQIPAEPAELVAGLGSPGLQASQREELSGALLALGDAALPALAAALEDPSSYEEGHKNAAELLARIPGDKASAVLIDALGKGSETRRRQLSRALGHRRDVAPALLRALEGERDEKRLAGIYRSLGIAGDALIELERKPVVDALLAALAATPGGYESQYRLLQAAGETGGSALAAALLARGGAGGALESAEELALFRLLVANLAAIPGLSEEPTLQASVHELLRSALDHRDPGVRLAVLASMRESAWAREAIAGRLSQDRWPEVRRSAAALLARHCAHVDSARALTQATRLDADTSVAQTALGALLRCPTESLLPLLVELIEDSKRPLDLRLQAGRVLGTIPGANTAAAVHSQFKKARRRALADRKSGKVASALTVALGDVADARAVAALESAAADPAFPQLQAASITALARLCPASSSKLFRSLRGSHEHAVATAARRASQVCR